MCHLSPTVHLGWAILSCGLQLNLIQHLWRYDRFKCLKWTRERQPGTFKRVMTYTYCTSVPLLLVYSVSMAVLKYKHGYTLIPGHGIHPTPYQLWPASDRGWLSPLYLVFSVVWGLELVTHMEELTFWLFLLHQGPTRREWFSSLEFKIWAISSLIAICGMPFTAILTRSDPLKSETYIFLVGSSASTCITAVFFIVLFKFPAFLRRVKKEGAAGPVVLRLVKFHELNIMRVIFRILFTLPTLVLGIDGVLNHHTLNESALWSDLLAFLAGFGAVISSGLTLLIFFPRSLAEDSHWRPRSFEAHSHVASFASGEATRFSQRQGYLSAIPSEPEQPGDMALFDNLSSVPPPPSSKALLSKSKIKYYSGHITSAGSTLASTYNPPGTPTLLSESATQGHIEEDWDLRSTEAGEVDFDPSKPWKRSDLGKAPDHNRDTLQDEVTLSDHDTDRRYSIKRNSKDEAQLKVRMMELGNAVDEGLKKPVRPPRLHPYITSFTSPIDLLHGGDDSAPRAI